MVNWVRIRKRSCFGSAYLLWSQQRWLLMSDFLSRRSASLLLQHTPMAPSWTAGQFESTTTPAISQIWKSGQKHVIQTWYYILLSYGYDMYPVTQYVPYQWFAETSPTNILFCLEGILGNSYFSIKATASVFISTASSPSPSFLSSEQLQNLWVINFKTTLCRPLTSVRSVSSFHLITTRTNFVLNSMN